MNSPIIKLKSEDDISIKNHLLSDNISLFNEYNELIWFFN